MIDVIIAVKPERRLMRLTKEQAEANRQRILAEAGELFRERGFDGISVAELMQAAGFTHGGFYNHFDSKSDLIAAVTGELLGAASARLRARTAPEKGTKSDTFSKYVDTYLSLAARDTPRRACPISTLSQDVARQDGEVKQAFAQGLRDYIEAFTAALPERAETAEERRQSAIAAFAALIGGLLMARAVAGADEAFSREILASVGAALKPRMGHRAGTACDGEERSDR